MDYQTRIHATRRVSWLSDRETVTTVPATGLHRRLRELRDRGAFEEGLRMLEQEVSRAQIMVRPQLLVERALCHFGCGDPEKALTDLARAERALVRGKAAGPETSSLSPCGAVEAYRLRCIVHLNRSSVYNYQASEKRHFSLALQEASRSLDAALDPPREASPEQIASLVWMARCARASTLSLLGNDQEAATEIETMAKDIEDIFRGRGLPGCPGRIRADAVAYMQRNADLASVRNILDLRATFGLSGGQECR